MGEADADGVGLAFVFGRFPMVQVRGVAGDDRGAAVFGAAVLDDVAEARVILVQDAEHRALDKPVLAVTRGDHTDLGQPGIGQPGFGDAGIPHEGARIVMAEDADLHPVVFDDFFEQPRVERPPPFLAQIAAGAEVEFPQFGGEGRGLGGELGDDGRALDAGAVEDLDDSFFFGEEFAVVFGLFEAGETVGVIGERLVFVGQLGFDFCDLTIAQHDEGLDVADVNLGGIERGDPVGVIAGKFGERGLGFDARSGRGGEVLFDLGALLGRGGEGGLGDGEGGNVRV